MTRSVAGLEGDSDAALPHRVLGTVALAKAARRCGAFRIVPDEVRHHLSACLHRVRGENEFAQHGTMQPVAKAESEGRLPSRNGGTRVACGIVYVVE